MGPCRYIPGDYKVSSYYVQMPLNKWIQISKNRDLYFLFFKFFFWTFQLLVTIQTQTGLGSQYNFNDLLM